MIKVKKINDFPYNDNLHDIYYTTDFGKLYVNDDSIFEIIYYDDLSVYYSYIKKKIIYKNNLYYDLSGYDGYTGFYISNDTSQKKIDDFINFFLELAKKNNYITQFIRINPYSFNNQLLQKYYDLIYLKHTYGINIKDYNKFYNSLNANKKHKKMVKSAINKQLEFSLEKPNSYNINIFISMYKKTMDRLNASSDYYYDDTYFKNILNLKNTFFGIIKDNDKEITSICILLFYKKYIHYHLSANDKRYNCSQNFLFHELSKICLLEFPNIELIHLGGGVKDGDGLDKFKSSISNIKFKYHIVKNILNNEIYEKLKNDFMKENKDCNLNFFPIYRQ